MGKLITKIKGRTATRDVYPNDSIVTVSPFYFVCTREKRR